MMSSSPDSPPKRPRLSLQIKAISHGPSVRTSRTLAAAVNPTSPTSFNTLSNVYVTAIGKSTPTISEPLTAINTKAQPLKLQTTSLQGQQPPRGQAPVSFPETPLTAQPRSPAVYSEIRFPSTMTATPPLSAGPVETAIDNRVFSFSCEDTSAARLAAATNSPAPMSPRTPRRRGTAPGARAATAPYTHPRSLHSILRNSPLPRLPARSPISPRRQSLRLAEKAARRVGYNSPLTQTITTNKYTKSHIDLLFEEASPYSPNNPSPAFTAPNTSTPIALDTPADYESEPETAVLDLTMAYSGDETRDGGQTPGPFEEMRRRMAGLAASSPLSSPSGGIRKRKRKEKKRRWVWTIGLDEEEGDDIGGALAATRAAEAAAAGQLSTPAPAAPAAPAKAAVAVAATTTSAAPVIIVATPRPRARSAGPRLSVATAAAAAAAAAGMAVDMTPRASAPRPQPQRQAQPPAPQAPASAPAEPVPMTMTMTTTVPPKLSIDTLAGLGGGDARQHQQQPPEDITPSIESSDLSQTWSATTDSMDVDMSDVSSVASDLDHRGLTPGDGDMDLTTPTMMRKHRSVSRLGSEDLFAQAEGARRDTPIPSDLICP